MSLSIPVSLLCPEEGIPDFDLHSAVVACVGTRILDVTCIEAKTADGRDIVLRLLGLAPPVSAGGGANAYAAEEILEGLTVGRPLTVESFGFDSQGRILALAWADFLSVNFELVRRGLAHVRWEGRFQRICQELRRGERIAQRDRAGIWSSL